MGEKDQYQVFFGGNHPLVEIHTADNTGRNLLVFKDSYANCLVPFYIPCFDNIYMIDPRYYYDNAAALLTTDGITNVLFLYSQNTFATDRTLRDVLNDAVGSAQSGGEATQDTSGKDAAVSSDSSDTSSQNETVSAVSSGDAQENETVISAS